VRLFQNFSFETASIYLFAGCLHPAIIGAELAKGHEVV
jgi:hypothetical protein